jgi:superfamily II DNA or RNA helicase
MFKFVEKHGKVLYDMIKNAAENRKVFFISGEVDGDVREDIRIAIEDEQNAILVASVGTTSTGINIPSMRNIVFTSPSKTRVKTLQAIGRILRLSNRKTKATLYDIADDLSWKSKKNYTLLHFIERVRIYASEKFKYKNYDIEL